MMGEFVLDGTGTATLSSCREWRWVNSGDVVNTGDFVFHTEPKENTMLFEVAIIKNPTTSEKEEGGVPELILPPTAVIARDSKGATAVAATKVDNFDPNRMEVLVRQFG